MGFPIGGDYLSITEGVLSRIEAELPWPGRRDAMGCNGMHRGIFYEQSRSSRLIRLELSFLNVQHVSKRLFLLS